MPQTLSCKRTGKSFEVSDKEIGYCERFKAPLPDLCPEERIRDLMAFRNEWKLYRRKCDKTGDPIISAYPPETPFPVYKNDIWWGDSWDATEYGRDYDFNRPFFEQFAELQKVVPREGTSVFSSENSEYNSHIRNSRNCYMNSLIAKCDDVHYSYWVVGDHDLIDCAFVNNSTLCYDCVDLEACYECVSLQDSKDCSDCHFSLQLQNCKHCLFSTNLINAEYRVFNKPVTKEEYETLKSQLFTGEYHIKKTAQEKFAELRKNAVYRSLRMINCEDCRGDHLLDCRNCDNCFDSQNVEDGINLITGGGKDLCNAYSSGWPACEMVFHCVVSRGCTNIGFCSYSWFSSGLRYCDSLNTCQDCIGCIGLRQKKYCILNKQYTLEEYKIMLPKVLEHMKSTGEWGRFFPGRLSPYGYNETAAQDYFPLTKEEADSMGYRWSDYQQKGPEVAQSISSSELPDVNEGKDILSQVLLCAESKKPYKIIAKELEFYQQLKLPIPRCHPETRHNRRFRMRNLPSLRMRPCSKCQEQTWSTFTIEKAEKVLCEPCYRAHLYG